MGMRQGCRLGARVGGCQMFNSPSSLQFSFLIKLNDKYITQISSKHCRVSIAIAMFYTFEQVSLAALLGWFIIFPLELQCMRLTKTLADKRIHQNRALMISFNNEASSSKVICSYVCYKHFYYFITKACYKYSVIMDHIGLTQTVLKVYTKEIFMKHSNKAATNFC